MTTDGSAEQKHEVPRSTRVVTWQSLEIAIYLVYAGIGTLLAANGFFSVRAQHLGWAEAARTALPSSSAARALEGIWWSAPLDDTFIHFDFARSFAKLRFFEWIPGGGYSSGATSWLYPLLLAIGVALGGEGQALGVVADVLACVAMFAFFWAARSLFRALPCWSAYLLPPFILTSGVLGWSIWSGMELALFFALWGLAAHFYVDCATTASPDARRSARLGLSITGLLLVMTRPEALLSVGLFGLFAARRSEERWLRNTLTIVVPALTFTWFRALTNLVLTGSYADAGALVKLHTLRPFLEPREVALKWMDNVGFQLARITTYHTTDAAEWGWQIWLLLILAFVPRRTRSTVMLLVLHALGWILLVAQNEYVRYQNDRYTMPAVLWLISAIALGFGGGVDELRRAFDQKSLTIRVLQTTLTTLLAGSFVARQIPRLDQQRWLFGRACKNIAEQQVRVGQLLQAGHFGRARRVLLGDAGAIPYFSGLAGVDAIGLGGTDGLPFAKAVNLGVGATVELIERMHPQARPDRLALYPSWWELLPVWFGRPLEEVRITGNVICGAANKVVYEADWRGLEARSRPATLSRNVRILDELDFADVVSEGEHGYALSSKHSGYVVMKLLPHPRDARQDLFDAGRLVFSDAKARFFLRGFHVDQPARLVFRAAPNYHMAFRVVIDGRDAGRVEMEGGDSWQEASLVLDPKRMRSTVSVELVPETSEHVLYHLWVTSP